MNTSLQRYVFLANGAVGPQKGPKAHRLHYINGMPGQHVRIGLPQFVQNVYYLPNRVLDLLEIAGYVFSVDRLISRGPKDAVEYHAWSRSISFHIRVRDYEFWNTPIIREKLSDVLQFMTGDAEYSFSFEPGHSTPPTSLFDRPDFSVEPGDAGIEVTLFSGGLDSLCGTLDLLSSSVRKIILVSHQSQPGKIRTQRALVKALQNKYPNRVLHYRFECNLRGIHAREETQRTRSFLYLSIAYAIASAYGENTFRVYENGVTSINLHRREDLANARASRTTHPQTVSKLAQLFSLIAEHYVTIELPFLFKTKTDVIRRLCSHSPELIASAVSCIRTFQIQGQATHCGQCFQCIDRRIAAYSAEAERFDHRGLYSSDIIIDTINDREARTTAVDYIRQAISFVDGSIDRFFDEYFAEITELLDYLPEYPSDTESVERIWNLYHKHGIQIKQALDRMRTLHEDVFKPIQSDSLLGIVSRREYFKPEVCRIANSIAHILKNAVGDMFARERPVDELDLNTKIGALLRAHEPDLRSEHPTISFACARVVPDHQLAEANLLIESKYIREGTPPSKITEGIAADLTKYPENAYILFAVYDPEHRIACEDVFRSEIEAKGRNQVLILR